MSKKWNADIMFPTDNDYQNRIVGAKFAPSNSGTPMVTLELEVVAPSTKEVNGEEYDIVGVKAKYYISCAPKDEEATAQQKADMKERALKTFKDLGMDEAEINWDNINVDSLKGKIVYTQMNSRVDEQRKTPTTAQLNDPANKGKHPNAIGEIMKHPVTNKKLVKYWPQIVEIYGIVG